MANLLAWFKYPVGDGAFYAAFGYVFVFLGIAILVFLFTILVSYFPLAISMYLTNNETLFSSFRLVHSICVYSSISPAISTVFGSPSKLGRGLPSCIYVWIKRPSPAAGFS